MASTTQQPPGGRRTRATKGETGQGLAEYGLILAGIALVCVLAVTTLGSDIESSVAWTSFSF
ncbi:MAG: Flp family type IVb pilin [Tepidiformaceae bacterium]